MADHVKIMEFDGSTSLTFSCGELPADDAVAEAGHEPNGYFWQSFVEYLSPELAERLEFDCESGMFAAYGTAEAMTQMQRLIEPYLDNGAMTSAAIRQAEASGFAFDD